MIISVMRRIFFFMVRSSFVYNTASRNMLLRSPTVLP